MAEAGHAMLRYGEPGHHSSRDWVDGSRCSPTRLIKTLRLAYEQPALCHVRTTAADLSSSVAIVYWAVRRKAPGMR